jgi:hypothetical protein
VGPGPGSGRMDSTTCPTCGADELATVLVEDSDGTRRLRSYCKQCERRHAERERNELRPLASGLARLLVFGGVLLAVLAAASDYLAISGRSGFGWRQMLGTELGFLAIATGLMLRRGLVAAAGLFLMVLSIGADWLHIGHMPGLGWRSHLAFAIATVLLCAGVFWRRALSRGAGLPEPRPRSGRPSAR